MSGRTPSSGSGAAQSLPVNIPTSSRASSRQAHPRSAEVMGSISSDISNIVRQSDSDINIPGTPIAVPGTSYASVSSTSVLKHPLEVKLSGKGPSESSSKTSIASSKKAAMSSRTPLDPRCGTAGTSGGKSSAAESRKRRDTDKSTFTLLFGGFSRQISMRSMTSGGTHRGHRVNVVTEAASVLPGFMSMFSMENVSQLTERWVEEQSALQENLGQPSVISTSHEGHLHKTDREGTLQRTDHLDTIMSSESSGSSLRRSLSVPSQYQYKSSDSQTRVQEIFPDDVPSEETLREIGDKRVFKKPMEDLVEQSEYENSVQSTSSQAGLLARTALSIIKGHYGDKTDIIDEDEELFIDPRRYLKNLMVLSVSFMLIFTAYLSLRNLQSSLNNKGGLGLYSLSSVYASLFLGCIVSTTVVQNLRPKLSMLISGVGFLVYCTANFHPTYFTLIPASCIMGFSLAILWTGHATYLTNIAARYAEMKEKNLSNVISKFNGLFYLCFQTAQIWGGIISSNVLPSPQNIPNVPISLQANQTNFSFQANQTNFFANTTPTSQQFLDDLFNSTSHCGASYCHEEDLTKDEGSISKRTIYTLMGIYTALCALGVLILLMLLDPLEGIMKKSSRSVPSQLLAVFRFFADWRVMCLLGLMFYSLLQNSFMFGEVTKAFVTCPMGVYLVGYAMLCMSAASAVSSYCNGHIVKYTGRLLLFLTGALVQFCLLIVMLLWKPTANDQVVIFIIAALWGVGDGIFLTQTISLFGVLFMKNTEPAFAALKMCQSLGACLLFVTSRYLCMQVKILIVGLLLTGALAGLVMLEFKTKHGKNQRRITAELEESIEV